MENVEIATVFNEMGDLLELQGANPFRVRAYRNAARTLEGLSRSLSAMVDAGEDLTELPTVGEEMADHIRELVETGRLRILEDLGEEVPKSLADLLRIEGIGPRRAQRLHQELGIDSIDGLEQALDEGGVEALEGFGAKSVENIRRAIADLRKYAGRVRIADADEIVRPLVGYLEDAPGIQRVEVAGSYRRRKETVGDLDLLAVCDDPGPVMDHFVQYEAIERVESAGETRGSVVLRSGLDVDLRIVPAESYGAALYYFTGSKAHNVAVRTRAVERGLKINEYGVFSVPKAQNSSGGSKPETGKRVAGETEESVFESVGLPWIPPELREDRGEIETADEGRLPRLLELGDIRGDLQMHSTWSDGRYSIRDMAEACRERGYRYLALTDHSQRLGMTGGLDERRAEQQWEEIERVREQVEGVCLFRSMEVDILRDGSLDLDDEHLAQLDILLVSVHSHMDLSASEQTERVVRAISHPLVHILGHPTGRRINVRPPYDLDVEEVLQAAKEHGIAVELNANPERLDLSDVHVFRARELGVPVVISTDAHTTSHLRYMSYGVDQARRGWLEKEDVLNTKTLGQLRSWLANKRGD